jgi:flagellar basal body-associated protein FliL
MFKIFGQQKGSALLGLLLVIVIIAALAYGSSFFWTKNKESKTNYKNIQKQLGDIEKQVEKSNQLIQEALKDTAASSTP